MSKPAFRFAALPLALALAGCATLQPALPVADAQLIEHWPVAEVASGSGTVADVGWGEFFTDPRLSRLVGLALDNNRDLRVALLNVERARAQYRIQRADRVPSLGIGLENVRERLRRYYPQAHELVTQTADGWVTVTLRIRRPVAR